VQQEEVARVASGLFGAEVHPSRIIGETLRRVTPPPEPDEQADMPPARGVEPRGA
jgi:hypothetical protein